MTARSLIAHQPWPQTKAEVIHVAQVWYDPHRVAIDDGAIERLDFGQVAPGLERGMLEGTMDLAWAENVALSIALNSINYQFWDLDQQGRFVRYAFEGLQGAQGMCLAFERAWNDPASALTQARQGRPLTLADVQAVFGDIPSPQSRAAILNEVLPSVGLNPVVEDLIGTLNAEGKVSTAMATRLANAFPLAYGDPVLKKAQLAISELWTKGLEAGLNVGCELTAFADYQIPNILRAMGVLVYAEDLAEQIAHYHPIAPESLDEQAIRGASILAVERIAQATGSNVAAVDHYLWTRRKEAQTPFHLTFTTAY